MRAQAEMLPGGLNPTEIANGVKPGWGLHWDLHGAVHKQDRLVNRSYITVSKPIPRAISHPMGETAAELQSPLKTLTEDLARPRYASGSFEYADLKKLEEVLVSTIPPDNAPEREHDPKSGSERLWMGFAAEETGIESVRQESTWIGNLTANDKATVEIPGGGTARLTAFAISAPSDLDPTDPGDFSTVELTFYDPTTSEALSADQLDALGIDAESRSIRTSSRSDPTLRLVLQLQDREHLLIRGLRVFDQRTENQVEADSDFDLIQTGIDGNGVSFTTPEPLAKSGLTTIDYPIDLWRDTPLEIAVDVLCGAPITRDLKTEANAQIKFGEHIRLQTVAARAGRPIYFGKHIFEIDEPAGGSAFLLRCTAPDHRRQLLFEMDGHLRALDFGDYPINWREPLPIWFSEVEFDASRALAVHYFPDRATMRFKIDSLPDMPNPRSNDSFLDIRIPRITWKRSLRPNEPGMSIEVYDVTRGTLNEWHLASSIPDGSVQVGFAHPEFVSGRDANWLDADEQTASATKTRISLKPNRFLSTSPPYYGTPPETPLPDPETSDESPPTSGANFQLAPYRQRRSLPTIFSPASGPNWQIRNTKLASPDQGEAEPSALGLQLLAFAVSVPHADDLQRSKVDPNVNLEFLYPETLEPIDAAELGLIAEDRQVNALKRQNPVLRLVLANQSGRPFRILRDDIYDSRTNASVSGSLGAVVHDRGELIRVDYDLGIWHDTPLRIGMDLATGEPIRAPLNQKSGEQIQLGDSARIQLVSVIAGAPAGVSWSQRHTDFVPDLIHYHPTSGTTLAFRFSSAEFAPHCGISLKRNGVTTSPIWLETGGRAQTWKHLRLMRIDRLPPPEIPELEVVFLPERSRVWFELPGLPQMPNGRDLTDLLDVKIPRIRFGPADQPAIDFIRAAAELGGSVKPWPAPLPAGNRPGSVLTDVTVRELLADYTKTYRLALDEETMSLLHFQN